MSDNNFSKNFFLGALLGLTILTIIIVTPLFIALATAGILAYLIYPLYKYLTRKIGNKRLASFVAVLLLFLLLSLSAYLLANSLTKEGIDIFLTMKQKLSPGSLTLNDCVNNPKAFCDFNNKIIDYVKTPTVTFYIQDGISKISNYITNQTFALISNLPNLMIDVAVLIFVIYYLLLDGVDFINKFKKAIPLKNHHVDDIVRQFENFTHATLYGKLIISLLQGIAGGIIFYLLGVQTPILAGIAMAFFSFLPVIGAPIIWLPTAITFILGGELVKGIILILMGSIVLTSIDHFLQPIIIGQKTKLHPAAILIGIFGGILVFGLLGILIGPLIISLLVSFIEVYYKEGY